MTRSRIEEVCLAIWLMAACGAGCTLEAATQPVAHPNQTSPPHEDVNLETNLEYATGQAAGVLKKALEHGSDTYRWEALRAAHALDASILAAAVLRLCESPDDLERVFALEIMAGTDPASAKEHFVEALNSGTTAIRIRGLMGLSQVGDADTVPAITSMLKGDPDPDVRAAAARALAAIRHPTATPALFVAIHDPSPAVRLSAVEALVAIGDGDIGKNLERHLLEADDVKQVQFLKLMVAAPDTTTVPTLAGFLDSPNNDVRIWAAAAILAASADQKDAARRR